jgi:hypothetical protein
MQELRAQIQAQIKLAATLRQVADQVKKYYCKTILATCFYFGLFWPTLLVFWQFNVAHLMPILAYFIPILDFRILYAHFAYFVPIVA